MLGSWLRAFARRWRRELDVALHHPLHAPSDPPYRRAGVVYFFVVGLASIAALVALADGTAAHEPFLVPFLIAGIATGLAEIRFTPERQTILNDLFYLVPFTFFSLPASALLLLLVAASDPIVHPRSLVRAMARASSILPMRMAALGGVLVGKEVVPEGHWWSWAAIALVGMLGLRVNDYFLFPISLRLGLGADFSWRDYLAETTRGDALYLGLEAPLIAVAATVYPHAPWLVVALAVPYLAAWRLALLAPAVDALREADELKSRFLSMASHELRTPLTSIAGFSATLRDRWDELPEAQRREFVGVIEAQSARLSRLIDQLLTMSRIEAGALVTSIQDLELCPLLRRAVIAAGRDDVLVRCDGALRVRADPDHLEQVVINLVDNAAKYGAPPVEVVATADDGRIELRVIDHGPGVPDWFRAQMYDQFAQASTGNDRSARGTGLGLSIVQRLVRAQGGELGYEPVSPTGACFVVRLPAAAPGAS